MFLVFFRDSLRDWDGRKAIFFLFVLWGCGAPFEITSEKPSQLKHAQIEAGLYELVHAPSPDVSRTRAFLAARLALAILNGSVTAANAYAPHADDHPHWTREIFASGVNNPAVERLHAIISRTTPPPMGTTRPLPSQEALERELQMATTPEQQLAFATQLLHLNPTHALGIKIIQEQLSTQPGMPSLQACIYVLQHAILPDANATCTSLLHTALKEVVPPTGHPAPSPTALRHAAIRAWISCHQAPADLYPFLFHPEMETRWIASGALL